MKVHWLKSKIRTQVKIWIVPALYILAAILAGLIMPRLDRILFVNFSIFSANTAVSLLSAIASGMLSFTGLVFSMSFLIVQFGSSAYSPRLIRYFLQDAVFRHSLGMFLGTFIYSLMALIVIGLPAVTVVSDLTVIAALVGVMGSIFWFLALIQHITSLQVTNVLYMVGDRGRETIQKMYPMPFEQDTSEGAAQGKKDPYSQEIREQLANLPPVTQKVKYSGPPLTILEIDIPDLVRLASRADAIIKIHYWVGDTVPDGAVLMEVRGGDGRMNESQLSQALEMSTQRTIEQDPKYAVRLIVDIGIRALSEAINDPTTAVQALDQLDDLLRRLGTHVLDVGYAYDRNGALRVIYPTPTWEDYMDLALHEIRISGARDIQVMRRLHALLLDLIQAVPPSRQPLVQQHLDRVDASVVRSFPDYEDRADALQSDRQGIGLSRIEETERSLSREAPSASERGS